MKLVRIPFIQDDNTEHRALSFTVENLGEAGIMLGQGFGLEADVIYLNKQQAKLLIEVLSKILGEE